MKKTITLFIFATVAMMCSLNVSAQQPVDSKPGTGDKKNNAENLPGSNAAKTDIVPKAVASPQIAVPQTMSTGIPDVPLPKPILPSMPADVNSKTPVTPEIKKPVPVILEQQKKQAIENR